MKSAVSAVLAVLACPFSSFHRHVVARQCLQFDALLTVAMLKSMPDSAAAVWQEQELLPGNRLQERVGAWDDQRVEQAAGISATISPPASQSLQSREV